MSGAMPAAAAAAPAAPPPGGRKINEQFSLVCG